MRDAEIAEVIALDGASGGRKDLGPSPLRNLDRGEPNTSCCGMDQHLVASTEPGQFIQRVVGGHKDDGNARCFCWRQPVVAFNGQKRLGTDGQMRAKAVRQRCYDRVTYCIVHYALTDPGDD